MFIGSKKVEIKLVRGDYGVANDKYVRERIPEGVIFGETVTPPFQTQFLLCVPEGEFLNQRPRRRHDKKTAA